jgi:radical SAM modification target selenobiotic family peptide
MKNKDLKKILAGLSITTLLAGTGAIGIGQIHAQGG